MSEPDPLLAALDRLHDRLDRLEGRLDRMGERLEQLGAPVERLFTEGPAVLAMVTDTADSFAARVGPDALDARLGAIAHTVERLTHPDTLRALDAALARVDRLDGALALLDPDAVGVARLAEQSLVASRGAASVGLLGALAALREAPVRRALGFAVAFARRFGVALAAALPTRRA